MPTGKKIKEIRMKKGMTQKKLGELCGIADANIRKYENGKQNPKIETLQKIANALDVDIWELTLPLYENNPLDESKQLSAFLSYLDTLGYEFIDGNYYDSPFDEVGMIHAKAENLDIPLTREEFDLLENSIKDDIVLEIYRIRKEKNI